MFPHACTSSDESSGRIPINISNAIVISSIHQLQISGQVLVALWLLTLEVQVEELHVEALLRMNGGNDDEATLGRPVDGIAVLLVICSDVLEVAHTSTLDLLWAVECN